MVYIILLTLIGINIAPFIYSSLNIWMAQQVWCWITIWLGFSWLLYKSKEVRNNNLELSLLFLWILIRTFITGRPSTISLVEFFNLTAIIIFYKLVQTITTKDIEFCLKCLKYVFIVTLFMGVLQKYNLSQWFRLLLETDKKISLSHNNLLTGFIGNGTHLSGFLASGIPIFLYFNKREDWLAILLTLLILCFTGTTLKDPAISGFIVTICVSVYFYSTRKNWWIIVLLCTTCCICIYPFLPKQFLYPQSRFDIWSYYLNLFPQMPVTGFGLGAVNVVSTKTPFPTAQHLHMEFFQFVFELGIIGGCLIVGMVNKFWQIKTENRLEKCLKGMVIGYLVSSCFNYPCHIWLPSIYAMFAYSSFLNIKQS